MRIITKLSRVLNKLGHARCRNKAAAALRCEDWINTFVDGFASIDVINVESAGASILITLYEGDKRAEMFVHPCLSKKQGFYVSGCASEYAQRCVEGMLNVEI